MRVDSFALIQALTWLRPACAHEFGIRELRLRLDAGGRLAHLDLIWPGAGRPPEALQAWENEPMTAGGTASPLTLRDVADRHGGELWFQRDETADRSVLPLLSRGRPGRALEPRALRCRSRPEYYDFDLFAGTRERHAPRRPPAGRADLHGVRHRDHWPRPVRRRRDHPDRRGAHRQRRLLRSETFEQLVDPRRRLEASTGSTASAERCCAASRHRQVLPAFHAFCDDTVLVGHNAAFDMRFLQMKEKATGVRFPQPVLDTLLLSAVIHPELGVAPAGGDRRAARRRVIGRHTALGDAIVTGEVFLK